MPATIPPLTAELAECAPEAADRPELMCALLAAAREVCARRAQSAFASGDHAGANKWTDLNIALLGSLRQMYVSWRDAPGRPG
jgi:hypothetical protein